MFFSFRFVNALLILLLVLVQGVQAQSGPLGFGDKNFKEEMATDRPDFTESPLTVNPGHLQFELGYTFTNEDGAQGSTRDHQLPEVLTRIGVTDALEARIIWLGFLRNDEMSSRSEGLSDLSLGFKHRLKEQDKLPSLSFIGEMNLPTGSSDFSANHPEPTVKLLYAFDFERSSISGNSNVSYYNGEEEYPEFAQSLSFGIDVIGDLATFIEYFALIPIGDAESLDQHYVNGGFTYAVTPDIQLDIRSGLGLNGAADDFFSGVGLSFRL